MAKIDITIPDNVVDKVATSVGWKETEKQTRLEFIRLWLVGLLKAQVITTETIAQTDALRVSIKSSVKDIS